MLIRLVEYDFPTVFSRRKGEDGYRVLHISRRGEGKLKGNATISDPARNYLDDRVG